MSSDVSECQSTTIGCGEAKVMKAPAASVCPNRSCGAPISIENQMCSECGHTVQWIVVPATRHNSYAVRHVCEVLANLFFASCVLSVRYFANWYLQVPAHYRSAEVLLWSVICIVGVVGFVAYQRFLGSRKQPFIIIVFEVIAAFVMAEFFIWLMFSMPRLVH
jgi:hypothetical protein